MSENEKSSEIDTESQLFLHRIVDIVRFLRDESGLGQALAYIRPLQKDLNMSPLEVI